MTLKSSVAGVTWHGRARDLRPMLAALEDAPLVDARLVYEPKYDGIRALVEVEPGRGTDGIKIWSRLGNDKTFQFPEIVHALDRFGRKLKAPVLLDGEIVALDDSGEPTGFQHLQGRIHLTALADVGDGNARTAAFVAFDILHDGAEDLRSLPLLVRRARLERIAGGAGASLLRLSEFVRGDGSALYRKALARGWEGVIAKNAESSYKAGRRSSDWRKLKIVRRQEFVVGGWTEPRDSRPFFGALLLGVYDGETLQYVGHTGSGFTHAELSRVEKILKKLETKNCPFRPCPRTNERPHWVKPQLVAEIKFSEWTTDGKLRHPIYLGLRDDVRPESVHREPIARLHQVSAQRLPEAIPLGRAQEKAPSAPVQKGAAEASVALEKLVAQLEDIEDRGGNGTLVLPNGLRLEVGNLGKKFWPSSGITKGELMRYYVRVSPLLLPALKDRPLVMKRFPNGIRSAAFYQQRAPAGVPEGVRVESVPGDTEVPSRLVGGSLMTLLYMTQLAVISQDPWFSRVRTPDLADYVAIDLDPMPGVGFPRVLDVARWVRDELEKLGTPSVPKTSGVTGLHIYIPLPPHTTFEMGRLFCQIIATIVAQQHPKVASTTRAVHDRGRTVYLDYLQNIRGKTLATAYSARASDFAGVSAPLTWKEVDDGVDPRDFTMRTVHERVRAVGDLWGALRTSHGADLRAILKDFQSAGLRKARPSRRAEED